MSSLSLPLPATARRAASGKRTAFGKIILNEARLTWRRPIGLIGGIGIPVVLLVFFGNLPSFQEHVASFGGLTPFDAYVPILAVFAVAMLAVLGLPIPLTTYRELGVLRRLSTTAAQSRTDAIVATRCLAMALASVRSRCNGKVPPTIPL